MAQDKPVLTIDAVDDAATGAVALRLTAQGAEAMAGRTVVVMLDACELLRATLGSAAVFEAAVPWARLLHLDGYRLTFQDDLGRDLAGDVTWVLRGDVFASLRVGTEDFFDRVQLHHSRFRSLFLVEIAARAFYARHPNAEFAQRAAALTILGHRLLERRAEACGAAELASIRWLVAEAGRLVPEGCGLIQAAESAGRPVDWRHLRWTVSLATVAGHLALLEERYEDALALLNLATRQTRFVAINRVSGLNLVICAFAEGLVAHLLARPEHAERALRGGVAAVKPIVAAQDLFENAWVLGDVENVAKAGGQCFIALVRLGYIPADAAAPIIDADMQISTAKVTSHLGRLLRSGRAPRLHDMLKGHGGG